MDQNSVCEALDPRQLVGFFRPSRRRAVADGSVMIVQLVISSIAPDRFQIETTPATAPLNWLAASLVGLQLANAVFGDPARCEHQRAHAEILAMLGDHFFRQFGEPVEKFVLALVLGAGFGWHFSLLLHAACLCYLNICAGKVMIAAVPSTVPTARCSPSPDQASAVTGLPSGLTRSSSRAPIWAMVIRPLA